MGNVRIKVVICKGSVRLLLHSKCVYIKVHYFGVLQLLSMYLSSFFTKSVQIMQGTCFI
jgi:hypothetical protein